MKKLVLLMHTSLDGFTCGPNGEMDWIKVDDELFDYFGKVIDEADTALYGRATYDMMQDYWPTAGDQPNASKHDKEHSRWYNKASKVVVSRSLKNANINAKIISENVPAEIMNLKKEPGTSIMMIGSPSIAQLLTQYKLIDEYRINVNPVIIGSGKPLFKDVHEKINLQLVSSITFSSGVIGLHYSC
jgi:dihydrofolate reductase